jgi:hypothetical protein
MNDVLCHIGIGFAVTLFLTKQSCPCISFRLHGGTAAGEEEGQIIIA